MKNTNQETIVILLPTHYGSTQALLLLHKKYVMDYTEDKSSGIINKFQVDNELYS